MSAWGRCPDVQRRARLTVRHHLGRTAGGVGEAVGDLVAVHAADPITPHLALWARVPGYRIGQLDAALCATRALWRMHAMRRTLFVVSAEESPVFEGAAARAVARKERRRVERWLEAEMDPSAVVEWLGEAERRTLEVLAASGERSTTELTAAVPDLATEVTLGSGKWATRAALSSRLLFVLAMEGKIVRTRPAGSWRSSQYRWATTDAWFERLPEPLDEAEARTALAHRYLARYGPVTTTDLRWWTGWTARQATAALDAAGAVAVPWDEHDSGWVLTEDIDYVASGGPAIALLPGLDPTPMGWKERHWFLPADSAPLFDRSGNIGPTVWADGRVVGGWGQRPDGEVVTGLFEPVTAETASRIDAEAAALTAWLGGTVVSWRFPVPYERQLSGS